MNNLLDIKTPAQAQAAALQERLRPGQSRADQPAHGLLEPADRGAVRRDRLPARRAASRAGGPIVVNTGKHTARSANDKFIVREPTTEDHVWWGEYNRPFSPDKFNELFSRLQGFLQGRDLFVQDCYAGADPDYRMPVRIVTELAWHSLFARNMFILPQTHEEYRRHVPEFTVICVPSFKGIPQIDGTRVEHLHRAQLRRSGCASSATPPTPARSRSRSSPC